MTIDKILTTPSPIEVVEKLNNVIEHANTSAPVESPTFTGVPTAPTATTGTNTSQIATTAFVNTAISNKTSISGNAGTANKLETPRTIDGVSFDGSSSIGHYGTCSTNAATAAKTVAISGFKLITGARVLVKFTVTNTAANPTLNVNSTGAKAIMYRGSAISAGYLAANRVYKFVYDGTAYEFIGDYDTNTTYSNMTAATASAAGKSGLVPAPSAGSQGKFLRGDGSWVGISSGGMSFSSNATVTASTESAKSYRHHQTVYTSYDPGTFTISGGSTTNSGSGYIYRYDTYLYEDTGCPAGSYTLQSLLQALVTRSHTHTITRTKKLSNCDCDCTDSG